MFSIFHSKISLIHFTISCEDLGFMNFTFHRTTSGMEAIFVVKRVFPIATLSVCTDPNHSEIDGAMTMSQQAINLRNSFDSKPSKSWILSGFVFPHFNISCLNFFFLLEFIKLNINFIFGLIFSISGIALTK
jgi:succinate dehydrogenase/fumarate reductase cytochrome b subunit